MKLTLSSRCENKSDNDFRPCFKSAIDGVDDTLSPSTFFREAFVGTSAFVDVSTFGLRGLNLYYIVSVWKGKELSLLGNST